MAGKRFVTGNDSNGKSYFVHDGPTPGHLDSAALVVNEIWVDDPARANLAKPWDGAAEQTFSLIPPKGGSVVRIVDFMPDGNGSAHSAAADDVADRFDTGGVMEEDNPGMHTTPTIDYGIVLKGDIILELDSGEVALSAGDVAVQRATRHAWHNRSGKPCTMAFVLISSPAYG